MNSPGMPSLSGLTIKKYAGAEMPSELIELRRAVYVQEQSFLSDDDIVNDNDLLGVHLCLYNANEELIAAGHVIPAEHSDFAEHSGLSKHLLMNSAYISRGLVHPAYRRHSLFAYIVYLVMREARMWGRDNVVLYVEENSAAIKRLLGYEVMTHVKPRPVAGKSGHSYEVVAVTQSLAQGLSRTFLCLKDEVKEHASATLADEALFTLEKRRKTFFENPWFTTINSGNLTRGQYLETLGNMHQFVRWTTRILARIIGITADRELRRHFIEHLSGEIDHEVLIENDLRQLGADVDYVVNEMVPAVATQEFMVVQESLVSFHQDPIVFLAVPFAIEGFSAALTRDFIANLEGCIASWGVKSPRRASSFISSHINTDGGDDGHWINVLKMMRRYLKTEKQLQQFLNVIHLVYNSLEVGYGSYVAKPDLVAAKPRATGDNYDLGVSPAIAVS